MSAAEGEAVAAAGVHGSSQVPPQSPANCTSVIGIDLSLTATGVATAYGLFTVKAPVDGDGIGERLTRVRRIVSAVLSHMNDWQLAVIEGPSYGQRQQAGEHLRAGLWWMTANTLAAYGADMVEVPPATLKKFATGKGNATKADMRMALFQRANLDVRDDNQVDAWWLRELGLHLLGTPTVQLPKTHTVALDKIRIGAP